MLETTYMNLKIHFQQSFKIGTNPTSYVICEIHELITSLLEQRAAAASSLRHRLHF